MVEASPAAGGRRVQRRECRDRRRKRAVTTASKTGPRAGPDRRDRRDRGRVPHTPWSPWPGDGTYMDEPGDGVPAQGSW